MMSHDFIRTWWSILASNPTGDVAPKIHGSFAQGTIFLKDGGHLFKVQACAARASSRSRVKQAVYGGRMGQNGILTLCVYILIYVYRYIDIYTCRYVYIYIHRMIHGYIYIYIHRMIRGYIYICVYPFMCIQRQPLVYSHILLQIYMNTYRQIHVYNQLDIVCVCV